MGTKQGTTGGKGHDCCGVNITLAPKLLDETTMNIFRLLGQYSYFTTFEPANRSLQPTSLISRQS